MKITLEQLKKLIRETVEQQNKQYSAEELLKAIYSSPETEEEEEEVEVEEEGSDEEEPVGEFEFLKGPRGPVREGAMKLIYTNYGILTEERVRELKECGYGVDECGMAGEMGGGPIRMSADYHEMDGEEPVRVVILGPGQEDVLEEGDTSTPADGGSVTGTQVAVAMPSGPGGAPAPSGAAVTKEAFNRRAEALLETWMKEEVEEELHGNQDKLDLDDDGEIEASDLKMLRRGLRDKHVGKDRKHR